MQKISSDMYDPRKVCKMWVSIYLVLENLKYLLFYSTFWVLMLNGGLKLSKFLIHTIIMCQKLPKIREVIV